MSLASKHYKRILAQWPVDLLRPDVSFKTVIQRRISNEERHGQSSLATPADKHEIEQANALYSLLEDRYLKKVHTYLDPCFGIQDEAWSSHLIEIQYPLSQNLMRPASNPAYYDNLLAELQNAPQRSWIGNMINKWSGFLRFS
ncbi:hypothetical protein MMC09_002379 [Bachmanniomyces sp. S44760]|nr:hypothetical protein [Bachmanniomyces sp. S44760]